MYLSGFLYFYKMSLSIVLFDDFKERERLLPLVATRPVGNLRLGALTINQKWELLTAGDVSYMTAAYLQDKFPLNPVHATVVVVNACLVPSRELLNTLIELESECNLVDQDGNWLATKIKKENLSLIQQKKHLSFKESYFVGEVSHLKFPEDIFKLNSTQIEFDTEFFTDIRRHSEAYDADIIGDKLYISETAIIARNVQLDTTRGSIVILDNAVIEAHCVIHGPAVISDHVRIKSGTVIYPNVTIGPGSTIGGELNNTVIWGNTSKGHYGYLGCAVVGEGCNLGAGTSNSNLQNDWSTVKLYSYEDNNYRNTGLLKCGVFIGDHSMLAIASKITTGSIVGVGSQIAMSNFIPKFVNDFSWLTDAKAEKYIFAKFVDMMERKAQAKSEVFTAVDKEILYYIYTMNRDNKKLN